MQYDPCAGSDPHDYGIDTKGAFDDSTDVYDVTKGEKKNFDAQGCVEKVRTRVRRVFVTFVVLTASLMDPPAPNVRLVYECKRSLSVPVRCCKGWNVPPLARGILF